MAGRRYSSARYRLVGIVGTSRIVTILHPVAYRLFEGAGLLGRNFGVRNVILTATGRRSGRPRPAPLCAFEDGERDRLWALAVDGFPGHARYQRHATRRIPVVVLEPDPGAGRGPEAVDR